MRTIGNFMGQLLPKEDLLIHKSISGWTQNRKIPSYFNNNTAFPVLMYKELSR